MLLVFLALLSYFNFRPPYQLPPTTEGFKYATVASVSDEIQGVGPWSGPLPEGDHWDPELLANGDSRNVEDRYRYWSMDAIIADLAKHAIDLEVAIENLDHDFNIGSIVRTANAMGVRRVHIVGKKRWNRRGAMVTDRYLDVVHWDDPADFLADCQSRGVEVIAIDNVDAAVSLLDVSLPSPACLVFGSEASGVSSQLLNAAKSIVYIPQRGSTRSMNVGHAAAIAMWAWVARNSA